MSRITDKIKEIKGFISEMGEMVPSEFEEYARDLKTKAACERYAEKIIEAMTDAAFMIIAAKKFKMPEDDIDAFWILAERKIITKELYEKLKDTKGMRNFIAHQYGKVDDKIVYHAVKEDIEHDAEDFIKAVKKHFK